MSRFGLPHDRIRNGPPDGSLKPLANLSLAMIRTCKPTGYFPSLFGIESVKTYLGHKLQVLTENTGVCPVKIHPDDSRQRCAEAGR